MLFLRYLLFLSLILSVSACSGNQLLESRFAPDPSLTVNGETDNNANSTEVQLPENFPSTIPLYGDAELVKIEENNFFWSSPDPSNLIMDYYQQELASAGWSIDTPEENLLIATDADESLTLNISFLPTGNETEFVISYEAEEESNLAPINITANPENNNGVATVTSSQPLQTLIDQGIIDQNSGSIQPHQEITRREYARWLVKANNHVHENVDGNLVRLANPNSDPVFDDVDKDDPDFPFIQGLAEAGLISSRLTDNQSAIAFNPDEPLTREDLISWKVPLDFRQSFPTTTIDNIKETWGFQDTNKIRPEVWQKLYIDWQNGENANVRRGFGFTTLFQPQKSVTKEEAAIILNRFGYQSNVVSLND